MGYRPAAFLFASGWDASNRTTFRVSNDGATFWDLYDSNGSEYQLASGVLVSATGRCIVPTAEMALALQAFQWLKVQSGPSSAPVNQSTAISFTVKLLPL